MEEQRRAGFDIEPRKIANGVLVSVISAIIFVVASDHDRLTIAKSDIRGLESNLQRMEVQCAERVSELEGHARTLRAFSQTDGSDLEKRIDELERHILRSVTQQTFQDRHPVMDRE